MYLGTFPFSNLVMCFLTIGLFWFFIDILDINPLNVVCKYLVLGDGLCLHCVACLFCGEAVFSFDITREFVLLAA